MLRAMNTQTQTSGGPRAWWAGWLGFWRGRPRWLRWTVWTLLIAYLAYLVLGNIFLNTLLKPVANQRPDAFQVQWGSAYTLFPGHVVARDVRLQGQNRQIGWEVQADRASGRLALLPLLKKEVRIPEVVATGVSGGARHTERNREPPPPREGGWTMVFERIVSDSLRRGYMDEVVLEGNGRASFGFSKQLRGGPMEIFPSRFHFDRARVLADGEQVLERGSLGGNFAIRRHSREQAMGLQKLLLTDGEIDVDAEGSSLRIGTDTQGRFNVELVPGGGKLQARLVVRDGQVQPGGSVTWSAPLQGTGIGGTALDDTLQVEVRVDEGIALRAQLPGREDGMLELDAQLRLQGTQIPLQPDLHALIPRTSGHLVGKWHFPSLAWVPKLFNAPDWLQLDGSGVLSADLQLVDGQPAPGSRIELPQVQATALVMDNRIEGSGQVRAELDATPSGALQTRIGVRMEHYVIASVKSPKTPYAKGDNLQLDVTMQGLPALGEGLASTSAQLRFSNAQVPDLRVYNRFLSTHARIEGGSGVASADLHLDEGGNIGKGTVSVQGRGARMSMGGRQLQGDVGIDARLRMADLAKRQFVLDGSQVRLRNVGFRNADGRSRQGWWTTVDLPAARIDLAEPAAVRGTVNAQASDAGFLLDMFGGSRNLPAWTGRLVDSGTVKAQGRVQWKGDVLVLDRVDARNDRYRVQARLRLAGKQRSGQLLAQSGPLSVGVDLKDGNRDMRFIRAREWFESHPPLLP